MTIQMTEDCTSTCFSKLSYNNSYFEDDELYTYIEITETLLKARPYRIRRTIPDVGSGDKNLLPMRLSLFAYVPPFIIFHTNETTKLPAEITKHLIWWQAKKNPTGIVTNTAKKSGFKTTNSSADNWCGTWCSTAAYSRLRRTKIYSKVNHFPSSIELGDKIALSKNFRRMKRKFGSKNFDFIPLTFILPDERYLLGKFMQKNGGFWIVKPPDCCAGSGIKIVSHLYEIPTYRSFVVQRYISSPRLIDGIKFDLRLYVLLTSIDPLRIYVYKEGLVRLATEKYVNHVNTLSNKFMHLTNTSVNKFNPNFRPNDDPNQCKGNMWTLSCLWKYLASTDNVDIIKIWTKIKDIAIKTVISAEPSLYKAWKKTSMSTYNFYQLFGFDVLLDKHYRPWLLEVNDFPSMESDTPLCKLIKGQLAKDYLNLVGFHVPDLLSPKELKVLRVIYKKHVICYNRHLYSNMLTWDDRKKQYAIMKKASRKYYLKSILKNLTPDDVRVLIKHEDEITQSGRFERVFPTCDTYQYFTFFEESRYYNLLLDAWEHEYGRNRSKGIERLRKLCKKKYHLS
ncbi:tubulin polyglutamylase TTLL4-like [Apis laboriosa]|uniref:tubulin polyglutamylase TTLL4-like n=1 Tax=Apis laboriosa TaxID=183418 RepID=UPI001CC3DC2C|nr:tubulin polyglutamylase TTLL4-like [Apis laboriosa]